MLKRLLSVFLILFLQTIYAQTFFDVYFKANGVEGGIMIYDEQKDHWIFNDEREVKAQTAPGATFHIIHALIGLEKRFISSSESDKKKWDGIPYYFQNQRMKEWEQDTSLSMALRYQNDWYFESLSLEISKEEYEYYLNESGYFNVQVNKNNPYFWQFSELTTTAEQQVLFLKSLYHHQLPFSESNQKYLLNQLLMHQDETYTLYAYPASTTYNGSYWEQWIGILKNNQGIFYFSTRIRKSVDDESGKDLKRLKFVITLQILESLKLI